MARRSLVQLGRRGKRLSGRRKQWFPWQHRIIVDPEVPVLGARPGGLERTFRHRLGRDRPRCAAPDTATRPSAVKGWPWSVHTKQ